MYEESKLCPFNTTQRVIPFGKSVYLGEGIYTTVSKGMSQGHKVYTDFEVCMKEQCMAWDERKQLCKRLK